MAEYEVTPLTTIDFGATGVKEILQNVAFILSTPLMSCPLDREFGWGMSIDEPINLVKARYTYQITEAIKKFEPRANIESIIFEGDGLEGNLKPRVRVSVDDKSI